MQNRERDKESGLTFETYTVEENGVRVERPYSVFIQSGNITKCISYMKLHRLQNVVINSEHKYKLQHVNFLKDNTFIKSVQIETNIDDCSALNCLHNLTDLSVHHSKTVVDFANFPNLERLNITWQPHFINIEKCSKLKWLSIWKYPEVDLSILKHFPNLEELELYDTGIESLSGIDSATKISKLIIERAKKLESINSLKAVGGTLKVLSLKSCPKLSDYTPIGALEHLADLYLVKCSPAANIAFIGNLNELDYGYIDIDIIDGQVELLNKLPIIFKNYKHFSHKNTLKIKLTDNGNCLVRNGKIIKTFY